MLNETRLTEDDPEAFYSNNFYNIIRRDRLSNTGGGVLVFLKKEYKIILQEIHPELELIYLKVRIRDVFSNFICCYKPPSTKNKLFFDSLELFLLSLDLTTDLFVIGDMNADPNKGDQSNYLNKFIKNFKLNNSVNEFTRVAKYGEKYTKSTIDLVLSNNPSTNSFVIDCSFSDHKFVTSVLNYENQPNEIITELFRNLGKNNLDLIKNKIKEQNYDHILRSNDVEQKWDFFKNLILSIVDHVAPLKKM
ncbi:unnamed protein product, partial [Brachionus calyciflorus]